MRRIAEIVPVIFAVIVINFVLIHAAPGDPIYILAGEYGSTEYYEMIREKYGLNKPLHEQLVFYVLRVLQGDLGWSYRFRSPVIDLILSRVGPTVLLVVTSLTIFVSLGVLSGVLASFRRYSVTDKFVTFFSLLGYSIPVFWLGQLLILFFSIYAGWFPVSGMSSTEFGAGPVNVFERVLDLLSHLVLPSVTLATFHLALISRLTRASMLDALSEDYVITARAKGLGKGKVLYHALRNALLPVATMIGLDIGLMMGGAVITETVFGWPGMGRLLFDAINARDYPLITGVFIILTIAVAVANLVTDLIISKLDPRIRHT